MSGNHFASRRASIAIPLLIAFWPGALIAGTITVMTTADEGLGSLRQAVIDVPANGCIDFDPLLKGKAIFLQSQILIDKSVTIDASSVDGGMRIINGSPLSRVFQITGPEVTLQKLQIHGGRAEEPCNPMFGCPSGALGGAIAIQTSDGVSNVEIIECTISGNRAQDGGAIWIRNGILNVRNSSIIYNLGHRGAGAITANAAQVLIENSTVSGNRGHFAVAVGARGHLTVRDSTVVENRGGGIWIFSDDLTIGGSIVSGNFLSDRLRNFQFTQPIETSALSNGYNVTDSTLAEAPFLTGPGDLTDVNPKIGPLVMHGGCTPVHYLRAGSPAIDHNAGCLTGIDQRRRARPMDGDGNGDAVCDSGACEIGTLKVVRRTADDNGDDTYRKIASTLSSGNDHTIQFEFAPGTVPLINLSTASGGQGTPIFHIIGPSGLVYIDGSNVEGPGLVGVALSGNGTTSLCDLNFGKAVTFDNIHFLLAGAPSKDGSALQIPANFASGQVNVIDGRFEFNSGQNGTIFNGGADLCLLGCFVGINMSSTHSGIYSEGGAVKCYRTTFLENGENVGAGGSTVFANSPAPADPAKAFFGHCTLFRNFSFQPGEIVIDAGNAQVTLASTVFAQDEGAANAIPISGPTGNVTSCGFNVSTDAIAAYLDHPTDRVGVPKADMKFEVTFGPTELTFAEGSSLIDTAESEETLADVDDCALEHGLEHLFRIHMKDGDGDLAVTADAGAFELSLVDTDGDGLPDAREDVLGTDPGDADSDHDGIGDATETLFCRDPLDGGDVQLTSAPVINPNGSVSLTFDTKLGVCYAIEDFEFLEIYGFQEIDLVEGTGGEVTWTSLPLSQMEGLVLRVVALPKENP